MSNRPRRSNFTNYESLESRILLACNLAGTAGADSISVNIGSEIVTVAINGVSHDCDQDALNIDAGGGQDEIVITDSSGNDQTQLNPDSVLIEGRVNVSVSNVETTNVISGGGFDSVQVFDSTGNETVIGMPSGIVMLGSNFKLSAFGYDQMTAQATTGNDIVFLNDSPSDDIFVGNETTSRMTFPDSVIDLTNFDQTFASANAGGDDQAVFNGSSGNDNLFSNDQFSRISNGQAMIRANGFDRVLANDSEGFDVATIVDTVEVDEFWGTDNLSSFKFGTQGRVSLIEFERITVIPTANGTPNDIAYVYGNNGNDNLYGRFSVSVFVGNGFEFFLNGFKDVEYFGGGGYDSATLIDEFGTADFSASSSQRESRIRMPNQQNTSIHSIITNEFKNYTVNALASISNEAGLGGHSLEPNEFFGSPTSSRLLSTNFKARVTGFKSVSAFTFGDNSTAIMMGSNGEDRLEAGKLRTTLSANDDSYRISFAMYGSNRTYNVHVNGMGGNDVLIFEDYPYTDDKFSFFSNTSLGQWGNIKTTAATSFETISVVATDNTRDDRSFDTALIFDTPGDDRIEGSEDVVTFFSDGFTVTLNSLDRIFATANNGGLNTWAVDDSLIADIFRSGDWVDA